MYRIVVEIKWDNTWQSISWMIHFYGDGLDLELCRGFIFVGAKC